MTALTTRSKIAIRWTTNPADMGYDGRPSNWMSGMPEMRSPAQALTFGYALSQKIGHGVYKRVSYQHRGREVSVDELRDVVDAAEAARTTRRYK